MCVFKVCMCVCVFREGMHHVTLIRVYDECVCVSVFVRLGVFAHICAFHGVHKFRKVYPFSVYVWFGCGTLCV